jgi:hypothetical protein
MEIIIIDAEEPAGKSIYNEVQNVFDLNNADLHFELRSSEMTRNTGIDPTVLVAIVSGTSSALTALIMGLLQILQRRKSKGKIIIELSNGTKIEAELGAPREEIDYLIEKAKELNVDLIRLD